jgi:CheY-like chemotaxis protein
MATIMVVDDVKSEVFLLSSLLRQRGYDCIEAYDGEGALWLAKKKKPDLILMDVVMGEHDGFKACRYLKKDPETKDIPVVFVTSKDDDNARFWAAKIGAADYLAKPINIEKLHETVKRFVP